MCSLFPPRVHVYNILTGHGSIIGISCTGYSCAVDYRARLLVFIPFYFQRTRSPMSTRPLAILRARMRDPAACSFADTACPVINRAIGSCSYAGLDLTSAKRARCLNGLPFVRARAFYANARARPKSKNAPLTIHKYRAGECVYTHESCEGRIIG